MHGERSKKCVSVRHSGDGCCCKSFLITKYLNIHRSDYMLKMSQLTRPQVISIRHRHLHLPTNAGSALCSASSVWGRILDCNDKQQGRHHCRHHNGQIPSLRPGLWPCFEKKVADLAYNFFCSKPVALFTKGRTTDMVRMKVVRHLYDEHRLFTKRVARTKFVKLS